LPGAFAAKFAAHSTVSEEWLGRELNPRHEDFQSSALPTELPSRLKWRRRGVFARASLCENRAREQEAIVETGFSNFGYRISDTGKIRCGGFPSFRNPVSGIRYPKSPSYSTKRRGKFTALVRRCRYFARGISMAPNCSRCGVTHWVSSRMNLRFRKCSTNPRSATFEASRTR
jgi:hypothetical protein